MGKSGKSNATFRLGRCPFYEEETDENGIPIQVFCENPEVIKQVHNNETPVCPYKFEYICDIPIHNKHMVRKE
jgi:hypothetical protein